MMYDIYVVGHTDSNNEFLPIVRCGDIDSALNCIRDYMAMTYFDNDDVSLTIIKSKTKECDICE